MNTNVNNYCAVNLENTSKMKLWLVIVLIFVIQGSSSQPGDKVMSRIMGGNEVEELQVTSEVAISIYNEDRFVLLGGGVLIRADLVLTTASCLKITHIDFAKDVRVVAGSRRRNESSNSLPSKEIIIHPLYDDDMLNDIALIKFAEEFRIFDKMRLLGISTYTPENGVECVTSGWGRTALDKPWDAGVLHRVNVSFLGNMSLCADELNINVTDLQTSVCAVGKASNYTGPCLGDYGGALICGTHFVGISSYSRCGYYDSTENLPSVYTEVKHYIEWVRENGSARTTSAVLWLYMLLPMVTTYLLRR